MSRTTRFLAFAAVGVVLTLSYTLPVLGQGGDGRQGGRGGGGRGRGDGAAQAAMPEAPPIGFFGSYKVAADKTDPSKLPIIGAWRMNFEKSDPGVKASGRFAPTATTIYTAMPGGVIKHDVFNSYPPTVDNYTTVFTPEFRSYTFKLDGQRIYKDPQGPNGQGQTAALWLVDRDTLFRIRQTKGVDDEWVMYRVSPDGKTLVWTSFNGDAKDSSHFVWDKIDLPKQ
jgi:hypothetical protein